jgi:hypothetical protein
VFPWPLGVAAAGIRNDRLRGAEAGAFLEQTEIALPPSAEQYRIIIKIDELLQRVNASKTNLAKAPLIVKAFRQSVLAAASSGRLTADWRDENQADNVNHLKAAILKKERTGTLVVVPTRFASSTRSLQPV